MIKEKLEIYQYQSTPNKGYQSPGPSGGGRWEHRNASN